MRKFKLFVWVLLAAVLAVSCEKEKPAIPVIKAGDVYLTPEAQSAKIDYTIENATTGLAIAASTDAAWISEIDCTKDGVITFKVALNEGDARTADVVLTYPDAADFPVKVSQQAAGFALNLSQKTLSFVSRGGEMSINVTSDRPWTISGGADWIKPSATQGNNGDVVKFTCAATKELDPRQTTFTFKCNGSETGMDLKVTQSELGRIIIEKASYNVPAEASDLTVTLQANTDVEIHVTSPNSSWVQVPSTKGLQTKKFVFKIAENPDNAVRKAIVQFKNADAAEQIEIIQAAMYPKNVADKFTDPNFKEYIAKTFDKDADGKISKAEAEAIQEIVLNDKEVKSIDGLEFLINLKTLDLKNNKLEGSIDLTANKLLEKVNLNSNKEMKKLNLEGLSKLAELRAGWSLLEELNLKGADNIKEITLVDVRLKNVEVSNLTKLESLSISGANCEKMDFSKNVNLTYLNIVNDKLLALDLTANKKLSTLYMMVDDTLTTVKGIEELTNLKDVKIQGSSIVSMSLPKADKLYSLELNNSMSLKTLDVSTNYYLSRLDATGCRSLEQVTLFKNQNIADMFGIDPSIIKYVDFKYPEDCASAISDPAFKKYILDNFDTNKDAKISKAEADLITVINCPNMGIKAIDGVPFFEKITEVICNNNEITKIDIPSAKDLVKMNAANNKLAHLDLSNSEGVLELYLQHNQLTDVYGVSGMRSIQKLDLSYNKLTDVSVKMKRQLTEFNISHNELTNLNVYQSSGMLKFDCSFNKLSSLSVWFLKKLQEFNCSNNEFASIDAFKLIELVKLDCSNNKLTTLNVAPNTKLQQLICKGCKDLTKVYVGDNKIPDIQKDEHTVIVNGQPE